MLILFRALLLFDSYSRAFLHYYPHLIDGTLITCQRRRDRTRGTQVAELFWNRNSQLVCHKWVTDVPRYQPLQWQQNPE